MQIRLPFQDYHDGKAGGGRRLLTAFRLSTNKLKNNLSRVQIRVSNVTGCPVAVPGKNNYLIGKKNVKKKIKTLYFFLLSPVPARKWTAQAIKIPSRSVLWQDG